MIVVYKSKTLAAAILVRFSLTNYEPAIRKFSQLIDVDSYVHEKLLTLLSCVYSEIYTDFVQVC